MRSAADSNPQNRSSLSPETINAALELWSQAEGVHYLPVVGGSMIPLLRDGDQVRVVPSHNAQEGQIVVFQRSGGLITHRVLRVEKDKRGGGVFLTKGDHVLSPDAPLNASLVLGRVVAIRRGRSEFDLEIPAWRWVESVMGRLMRFQSDLQQGSSSGAGTMSYWNVSIRRNLSRVILLAGKIFLITCQWIFGRWSG